MLSLQLGPLALPLNPLLWLGALWLAQALAARLARPRGEVAGLAVLQAALIGFVVARAVFVLGALDAYRASPWSLIDLRDGGWSPWPGVAAALAWLAWRGARDGALRRPLAVAAAAGALFWGSSSMLLGVHERPPLPPLVLHDLQGAPVELAVLAQGRPTVINLWASWCAPCRVEMPMLAAAQQRETGVRFLFVNQGETAAAAQRYLAAQGFALEHVLLDRASQLGPAVGSTGLPTTLFYDAQGRLIERHFGIISAAALASRLRGLRGLRASPATEGEPRP